MVSVASLVSWDHSFPLLSRFFFPFSMSSSSSSDNSLPMSTLLHMITIKLSSSNYLIWKNQMLPFFLSKPTTSNWWFCRSPDIQNSRWWQTGGQSPLRPLGCCWPTCNNRPPCLFNRRGCDRNHRLAHCSPNLVDPWVCLQQLLCGAYSELTRSAMPHYQGIHVRLWFWPEV